MQLHRSAAYFRRLGFPDMLKLADDIEKALVDVEKAKFDVEMTIMRPKSELRMEKRRLELEVETELREVEIMAVAAPEPPAEIEEHAEPTPAG